MTTESDYIPDTIESLSEDYGPRYRLWAVLTIGLGAISTVLSSTNINVAIPSIMGAYGIGQDVAQWLSAGFLAAATVTMLSTAWLIQAFGMRLTFIVGLIIFILSSFLGAVSPNAEILILSRIIQGASSGIFMPLSMLMMTRIFPPQQQGLAMGIFGILVIMAPAFGPYLGGLIIDNMNWRLVFYMPVPMALVGLVMALFFLPEREESGHRPPFDWLGALFLSAAISLLLLGLSKGQSKGWSSNYTLTCFSLLAVFTTAFLYRQTHILSPLLNLSLFKYPAFRANIIITLIFGAGLYSTFYTIPLFLQSIQGLNATSAGLSLLPGGLILAIIFPIAGKLSDKLPHWLLIGAGLIIFSYSSWAMIVSNRQTYLWLFVYWVTLGRIGVGLIMPALNSSTFQSVPDYLLPQASGASNFFRQLGGALGVNLSAIYLERQTTIHVSHLNSTQHFGNPQTVEMISQLLPSMQQLGISGVQQEALAFWVLGKEIYRQALTLAFQDTFLAMSLFFMAGLIPTLLLYLRTGKSSQ